MTGLRPAEAQHLEPEDIDLEHGYVTVRNKPDHRVKTGDERVVPLAPPAEEIIRRQLETGSRYVFTGPSGGKIHLPSARRVLKKATPLANLPAWTCLRILRHSCACYLKARGLSDGLIAAVLGHEDPRTLKHYARLLPETVKAAVDAAFEDHRAKPRSGAGALLNLAEQLRFLRGLMEESFTQGNLGEIDAARAALADVDRAVSRLELLAGDLTRGRNRPKHSPKNLSRKVQHSPMLTNAEEGPETENPSNREDLRDFGGAEHGARTRDLNLGKSAFQVSFSRFLFLKLMNLFLPIITRTMSACKTFARSLSSYS